MDRTRGSKIWSGITLQGQAIPRATTAPSLPNHAPHEPHNLVIQEGNLRLHDRTGQGRAMSRGKSQQRGWSLTSDLDGTEARGRDTTGTLCSMRQYSASGCSRPTELYMVCPWKGEGLYLQLTCVSRTKRIYTKLCILLKCMELCVYICVCVCVYIYQTNGGI